jgi:hypothetical protein
MLVELLRQTAHEGASWKTVKRLIKCKEAQAVSIPKKYECIVSRNHSLEFANLN